MKIIESLQGVTLKSLAGLVLVTIVVVAAAPKLISMVCDVLGVVAHGLGAK